MVQHYLDAFIFPEAMHFQQTKLSASGQELGGAMLFSRRLGFSGTPSNLLPRELGARHTGLGLGLGVVRVG